MPSLAPRSCALPSFLLPPHSGLHYHCPGLIPSCPPRHCCQSYSPSKGSWNPAIPYLKLSRWLLSASRRSHKAGKSGPACLTSLNPATAPPSLMAQHPSHCCSLDSLRPDPCSAASSWNVLSSPRHHQVNAHVLPNSSTPATPLRCLSNPPLSWGHCPDAQLSGPAQPTATCTGHKLLKSGALSNLHMPRWWTIRQMFSKCWLNTKQTRSVWYIFQVAGVFSLV